MNHFYICACADTPNGGIYLYDVDDNSNLKQLSFAELPGSNYICFSPDRKYLYSTRTRNGMGGIASFRINADDTLTYMNEADTMGKAACHLACSPDNKFIYCVNYLTGNFAEFKLNSDGTIGERTQLIQHEGHGPRADRQECAHTHCTVFTPDQKYLCVVDLGVDTIFLYPFTAGKGIENKPNLCKFDPADGPRHILFDESGKFAYVANELGNTVTTFAYADGVLTKLNKYTTLPPVCTDPKTKVAAIRFSPDKKNLFVTNRGYDSVACYHILEPGKLALYEIVPSLGSSPRDINFLPDGKTFAAANEFSDIVTIYSYDAASGKLAHLSGKDVSGLPRPLCVLFQ